MFDYEYDVYSMHQYGCHIRLPGDRNQYKADLYRLYITLGTLHPYLHSIY